MTAYYCMGIFTRKDAVVRVRPSQPGSVEPCSRLREKLCFERDSASNFLLILSDTPELNNNMYLEVHLLD